MLELGLSLYVISVSFIIRHWRRISRSWVSPGRDSRWRTRPTAGRPRERGAVVAPAVDHDVPQALPPRRRMSPGGPGRQVRKSHLRVAGQGPDSVHSETLSASQVIINRRPPTRVTTGRRRHRSRGRAQFCEHQVAACANRHRQPKRRRPCNGRDPTAFPPSGNAPNGRLRPDPLVSEPDPSGVPSAGSSGGTDSRIRCRLRPP